jgi:hypothetical protein
MRTGHFIALMLALMLVIPVQGNGVSVMQSSQDDAKQPDANNTTLRIWSDGSNNEWSHFGAGDDSHTEDNIYEDTRANGLLTIDLKFTMKPSLIKRLNMTLDGEIRGQIKVYLEGDYTNGDNDGPCNNDCENLTLTLKAGATEIWSEEYGNVPMGEDHQILFSHRIEEGQTLWDKTTANPSLHVNMKLKGDDSGQILTLNVEEGALFRIYLSGDNTSKIELPIDPATWDAAFQSDEPLNPPVETPGFTLVAGTVAMAMAAVWFRPSKIEDEDSQ